MNRGIIPAILLIFCGAALSSQCASGASLAGTRHGQAASGSQPSGPQTLRGEIDFLDSKTGRIWLRPEGAKKDVIIFVLSDTKLRRGKEKLSFQQLELGAQALVKVKAWREANSRAEAAEVEILKGPGKAPASQVAIFGTIWRIDRAKSTITIRQGRKKFEVLVTPNAVITDGIKRLAPLDLKDGQLLDVKATRGPEGQLEAVHVRILTSVAR
jgi:hypothetical protein